MDFQDAYWRMFLKWSSPPQARQDIAHMHGTQGHKYQGPQVQTHCCERGWKAKQRNHQWWHWMHPACSRFDHSEGQNHGLEKQPAYGHSCWLYDRNIESCGAISWWLEEGSGRKPETGVPCWTLTGGKQMEWKDELDYDYEYEVWNIWKEGDIPGMLISWIDMITRLKCRTIWLTSRGCRFAYSKILEAGRFHSSVHVRKLSTLIWFEANSKLEGLGLRRYSDSEYCFKI